MANKRISELTSITGANLADADLLVVVDVSDPTMAASGTNKKITMAELAKDSALTDNLIAKTTLTTDGDVLTRAAGVPDRITRADLAQDSAFSSRYAPTAAIWFPGSNANYASTPDVAALDLTGDMEIVARVAMDDWTPSSSQGICGKGKTSSAAAYSYVLIVDTNGGLNFQTSDGTNFVNNIASTTPVPVSDGTTVWVRAQFDLTDGSNTKVTYAWAADSPTEPSSWTTLDTKTRAIISAQNTTNEPLVVGATADNDRTMKGKLFRVIVRDGIGGTIVADWNAAAHLGGTRSRDVTGKVWTLNGSAWTGMLA